MKNEKKSHQKNEKLKKISSQMIKLKIKGKLFSNNP